MLRAKIRENGIGKMAFEQLGRPALPFGQEQILRGEAVKLTPLRGLFWTYLTPASILPLCLGMAGLVGKITVP